MSVAEGFGGGKTTAVVTLVLGALSVLAGIVVFLRPGATLLVVTTAFGVAVLCSGVAGLVTGIVAPGGSGRAAEVVLGVTGIVAGVLALRHLEPALLAFVLVSGTWLVVAGTVDVVVGVANPEPGRALRIVAGGGDVLVGALVLATPGIGLVVLAVLVGVALVLRGGVLVAAGVAVLRATTALAGDIGAPAGVGAHHA